MSDVFSNNERELLTRISAGDELAFRKLFDAYKDVIYSAAYKWTQSDELSKDILQDIFIKLWVKKESLSTVENLKAYLLITTRNHVFNAFKKIARSEAFMLEMYKENKTETNTAADFLMFKETGLLLKKAMDQLPPQQRKVFTLGKLEGYKLKEIAVQMSISVVTVNKHMALATKAVKEFLIKNGKLNSLLIAWLIHKF